MWLIACSAVVGICQGDEGDTPEAALQPLEVLYRILTERGVEFDQSKADVAALVAVLESVDPRAEIAVIGTNGVPEYVAPELVADRWEQGIGYLDIPYLSPSLASNVVHTIDKWTASGAEGIILDLRECGGGSLDAVDTVAGLVVPEGASIYAVESPRGEVLAQHTSKGRGDCEVPVVVLVDRGTRDGAEVLAAALKKQGCVMLVGERTRGDATVRRSVSIASNIAARIAWGRVRMGEDCDYHGEGVSPDVPVDGSSSAPSIDISSGEGINGRPLSEKAIRDRQLMKRIENDFALRRAADILLGLKALGMMAAGELDGDEDVRPEDK